MPRSDSVFVVLLIALILLVIICNGVTHALKIPDYWWLKSSSNVN